MSSTTIARIDAESFMSRLNAILEAVDSTSDQKEYFIKYWIDFLDFFDDDVLKPDQERQGHTADALQYLTKIQRAILAFRVRAEDSSNKNYIFHDFWQEPFWWVELNYNETSKFSVLSQSQRTLEAIALEIDSLVTALSTYKTDSHRRRASVESGKCLCFDVARCMWDILKIWPESNEDKQYDSKRKNVLSSTLYDELCTLATCVVNLEITASCRRDALREFRIVNTNLKRKNSEL